MPTEIEILRAQVELLRECHTLAAEAIGSAWHVAQREGRETNWAAHQAQLEAAMEASHAAMASLREAPTR